MSSTGEAQYLLSDLRKKAGLTQSEVADRMGVNRARVGQIEQDFPRVRFDTVQAYVEALGSRVTFWGQHFSVRADQMAPDPRGPRDHGYRASATG